MWTDPDSINEIEFGVCLFSDESVEFHRVPITREVKASLRSILAETRVKLHERSERPHKYEPSQNYGPMEHLKVGLNDPMASNLKEIFGLVEKALPDPRAMHAPDLLWFYFAIFRHKNGEKSIAVKRAAQFKAVVAARQRLLQIGPDALQPVSDNVFRLDHEFDFVIDSRHVTILYPTGFNQIANTESLVRSAAVRAVASIRARMPFIDFSDIERFVERSIKGARLIVSISMRNDLEQIRPELLRKGCKKNGIDLIRRDDLMTPERGHEKAFLEYLDGRRYTFDAVTGPTDRYLAQNRRRIWRRRVK